MKLKTLILAGLCTTSSLTWAQDLKPFIAAASAVASVLCFTKAKKDKNKTDENYEEFGERGAYFIGTGFFAGLTAWSSTSILKNYLNNK